MLAFGSSGVTSYQKRSDATSASIPSTVNYVLLQGYTTPGDMDGLQMLFIRGTTPTQGSFVSADGQRWILTNRNPHVGIFGAVGDGTTDDSTAILNAIAFVKTNNVNGGTIFFSNKIYAVGTTITIGDGAAATASTYNGIVLAGWAGVGASPTEFTADVQGTTIKWIGAANGTAVKIAGPINSCGLSNICINGNVTTSKALYLSGSYKGRFDNVLIKSYSQNNATDTGLYIDSVALPATVTVGGDSNLFINLQVENAGNNTGRSIYITGSNYNTFSHGLISIPGTGKGVSFVGTATQNASFNTFTGVRIVQQNTGTGTPVTYDATVGTVKDNTFQNCEMPGGSSATNSPGNNPVNNYSRVHPQGRLTLTSATPVMTTTTSGQTTVYYTPYIGEQVPIYNGAMFVPTTFTEMSQATTDNTKSPAAVGASSNYDVFVWNDSGTIRATRGPAWSTATTRGTGAGTTELQRINGILTNKVAITNGPGANRGTYVGTIRSNAASTIDWTYGAAASGGSAAVLNVWNCYNRVEVGTIVIDNGTSYAYGSATTRQARNSATNQINFVRGLDEDVWLFTYQASISLTTTTITAGQAYIGIDSTTAGFPATTPATWCAGGQGATQAGTVTIEALAGIGSHFAAALEVAVAGVSSSFNFLGFSGLQMKGLM